MSLNALLKEQGISKTKLAELMGVDRKTVQRLGDEITPEVLEALSTYEPVANARKKPEDYTNDEIRELCHRRGGLEADLDREKETDYEIACKLGITVFDFHWMIDKMTGKIRQQLRRPEGASDAYIRENKGV